METRKKILEAAITAFTAKGYAGATMDHVMEIAGVSKGSLYYHFDSKHDLFVALFDYWFAELGAEFGDALGSEGTPWERLREAVLSSLQLYTEKEDVFKIFMEFFNIGMKDELFRQKISVFIHQLTEQFSDVVKEGVEAGLFEVEDPEHAVIFVFSMLDGLALRVLISDDDFIESFDENILLAFVARMFGYKGELR
jgi:TetR/AcrR family transcriptional regulator